MTDTWERQRRTFERTAEAYDRYRPSYPPELFEDIRAYVDLAADDRILEIACGTGKATQHLAAWGNPLVAIDSAPAMADRARHNVASRANVEVRVLRFEELSGGSFALVACAQAWHWLDPETRIERLASLLRPGGVAAIIANVPVIPEHNLPFWVRVQDVYLEHAPDLARMVKFRKPEDLPAHPLEGAEQFDDLVQCSREWHWTLPASDYVGFVSTHSPHAALDDDVRLRLTSGIADLIEREFDGHVTEYYVAMAGLARRT